MTDGEISGLGVWGQSSCLRPIHQNPRRTAARDSDELGFAALWIPVVGGPVFDAVGRLLAATKGTVIATGILNLWMRLRPAMLLNPYAALTAEHGNRFLLGIGVSHARADLDASQPGRYCKPLAATVSFLDALDAAQRPVPAEHRVSCRARP